MIDSTLNQIFIVVSEQCLPFDMILQLKIHLCLRSVTFQCHTILLKAVHEITIRNSMSGIWVKLRLLVLK